MSDVDRLTWRRFIAAQRCQCDDAKCTRCELLDEDQPASSGSPLNVTETHSLTAEITPTETVYLEDGKEVRREPA